MLGVAQPAALQMSAIEAPRANAQERSNASRRVCSHTKGAWQGRAEPFGGAGAQSIKGAHGARFNRAVLLADMCIEWMLLYWYSSKFHDAGLKKKHRTEKTILSLNVKDIFAPLNYSGMILYYCCCCCCYWVYSVWSFAWLTGAQVRKQTDWLNQPSASRLTSQKSVNSQHIETPSPRYHTIEIVSVPRLENTENVKTNFWVTI